MCEPEIHTHDVQSADAALQEFQNLGTRGQAGLDLDVYSPVTDSTRDVKTLSGGNLFWLRFPWRLVWLM